MERNLRGLKRFIIDARLMRGGLYLVEVGNGGLGAMKFLSSYETILKYI